MIRSILGFHRDSREEWVAELCCYHGQHVRHRPPFQDRAWVLDPDGRAARLGSSVDCPVCDQAERSTSEQEGIRHPPLTNPR